MGHAVEAENGSACGPVIVPVFKTGGRRAIPSPVGSTPTRFRHSSWTGGTGLREKPRKSSVFVLIYTARVFEVSPREDLAKPRYGIPSHKDRKVQRRGHYRSGRHGSGVQSRRPSNWPLRRDKND